MTNAICNEPCLDTMARMPDDFVDLTVTSPPYGNLRDYLGNSNFDFELIAIELFRVTKPGGVVVWVVGDVSKDFDESGDSFRQALFFKDIGFKLFDTMIYQKTGISYPDRTKYYQIFEYMFVFSKLQRPKTINLLEDRLNTYSGHKISGRERRKDGTLKESWGTRNKQRIKQYGIRYNIWSYDTGYNGSYFDDYVAGHPAVFPEKLAEDHILSWSNRGDLVYDPFLGSGTTAKSAIYHGRDFMGSEICAEYFEIASRRVREALEKIEREKKLFGGGGKNEAKFCRTA